MLQEILVDEWGFDGFVVSDWGGSNDHALGVKNGSHLEMQWYPYVKGTTVLNGGVSMVVFFFVNKIIFPEGEAK